MQPFRESYAVHYDLFYADKDYEAECDLIEAAIGRYAGGQVEAVLDLGCGTGGHSLPMARRGYQVTGVDQSAEMLQEARRKADQSASAASPEFHLSDIGKLELGRRFDLVLMMFAVLGYQSTDEQLRSALLTVRSHLRTGGIFLGDVWYGPAVLAIEPSYREMRRKTGSGELLRTATPHLDIERHLCRVDYTLHISDGAAQELLHEESHSMRFFFHDELESFFDEADLELLALHPFPHLEGAPDETTWNAWFCARMR